MAIATALVGCAAGPRPIATRAPALAATAAERNAAADDEEADDDGAVEEPASAPAPSPCPAGMALISSDSRRFCVDRYEASLMEVLPDGTERPYPHYLAVDGHEVRAVSEPGVYPQGYISELQAEDACKASGKRLCTHDEWKTACRGPANTTFPYGNARSPGVCHDSGRSPVVAVFGAAAVAASPAPRAAVNKPARPTKGRAAQTTRKKPQKTATRDTATQKAATRKPASQKITKNKRGGPARASARPASVDAGVWTKLNDPGLGQVEGALAHTGDHGACLNEWGVYDMVGNLHEWVATDPSAPHGTFAGGYYLDTALNGDGCEYRTVAHAHEYHDYSTGFRCCADLAISPSE